MTQLDRIEDELKAIRKDMKDFAEAIATNKTDIAWLKRGAGALGALFSGLHAWILHRQS